MIQAINSETSLSGLNPDQLQSILNGSSDTAAGSIQLRSNNREYFSRGVQLSLNWNDIVGSTMHDLEFGIRFHEDEKDRLQRNSNYSQINGALILDDLGILGNTGNRLQEVEAVSTHIHDKIQIGDWTLSPGLRYEDIDQKRTCYSDGELRTFRDSRKNATQLFLSGIGVLYQLSDSLCSAVCTGALRLRVIRRTSMRKRRSTMS